MDSLKRKNDPTSKIKKSNVDVSVVFVQYNPDIKKTLLSLYALINQKDVNFEIIIADDGSKEDYFEEIQLFFFMNNFSNYQLHKNNPNVGTVKNFLSGIELCKGEYVRGCSPGDILKDEYVLRDSFDFASKHKARCIFSKAVYYHKSHSEYKVFSKHMDPIKPNAFNWVMPRLVGKYSLFNRYWILGASMFLRKDYANKYFRAIEITSRLVEDNTTALYSVMNGERIIYFDRVTLWYEADAPTTDKKQSTSRSQIEKDFAMTLQMIDEKFSKDALYDFARANQNRYIRILKHPYIKICSWIFNHLPDENTPSGGDLEIELNQYINYTLSMIENDT